MKRLRIAKNIDISKYINIENGNLIVEDHPKVNIKTEIMSNNIELRSNDFMIIPSEGMKYLNIALSSSDLKKFFTLAPLLKTNLCIIFNHNIVHTRDSIAELLECSPEEVSKLFKRFEDKGVGMVAKSLRSEYGNRLYVLNPFIIRKRNIIDDQMLTLFYDLKELKHKKM